MADEPVSSFEEFWPCYVRAHERPGTRILHAIGSVLALLILIVGVIVNPWLILLAPIVGYGFAWSGHFFVEHNKPATFGHPFWSLAADYRMLFLMVTGKMNRHVRAAREKRDAAMMAAEDL